MHAGTLEAALERGGVQSPLRGRLARYGALVLEANQRFNVTGAKSQSELVEHLLDSLTVLPFVREPYVDLGSGGGFPAIPVALAAAISVTMIESNAKKARLLESFLEELGLRGSVIAERGEVAGRRPDLREAFASGTARAVAVAPAVAEMVVPFLRLGGVAVLQRGALPESERAALADASMMLGAAVEDEIALGGERRIVLLRKTGPTMGRFPRRPGVPGKRPLCL